MEHEDAPPDFGPGGHLSMVAEGRGGSLGKDEALSGYRDPALGLLILVSHGQRLSDGGRE